MKLPRLPGGVLRVLWRGSVLLPPACCLFAAARPWVGWPREASGAVGSLLASWAVLAAGVPWLPALASTLGARRHRPARLAILAVAWLLALALGLWLSTIVGGAVAEMAHPDGRWRRHLLSFAAHVAAFDAVLAVALWRRRGLPRLAVASAAVVVVVVGVVSWATTHTVWPAGSAFARFLGTPPERYEWPWKAPVVLGFLLGASALDAWRRTRSRGRAWTAVALLPASAAGLLAVRPYAFPRVWELGDVASVAAARVSDSGVLVLRVVPRFLPHDESVAYALVTPETGSGRLRCLTRRPIAHVTTYMGLAGELSPDGAHVVTAVWPSAIDAFWGDEEERACEEVQRIETATGRLEPVGRRCDWRSLPVVGPRGALLSSSTVHLPDGRRVALPGPEHAACGWFAGDELRRVTAEPSASRIRLTRVDLPSGRVEVREVGTTEPDEEVYRGLVAPGADTAVVAMSSESVGLRWLEVDGTGRARGLGRTTGRGLVVWTEQGSAKVHDQAVLCQPAGPLPPLCTEAVEIAGEVYAVACDSYHGYPLALLRLDRGLRDATPVAEVTDAQLLRRSIVYVEHGRAVVRLWPAEGRRETLFEIPHSEWNVWTGWRPGQ